MKFLPALIPIIISVTSCSMTPPMSTITNHYYQIICPKQYVYNKQLNVCVLNSPVNNPKYVYNKLIDTDTHSHSFTPVKKTKNKMSNNAKKDTHFIKSVNKNKNKSTKDCIKLIAQIKECGVLI